MVDRPSSSPLDVRCPHCWAQPGEPCRRFPAPSMIVHLSKPHKVRGVVVAR